MLIGTGHMRHRMRTPHAGQVERAASIRTVGREPPARDLDTGVSAPALIHCGSAGAENVRVARLRPGHTTIG